MRYPAFVTKEGHSTLAEFPDCPGCQTFADPGEDILAQAEDALHGWLEATLAAGEAPAAPSERVRAPKGGRLLWVTVPARLAVKLSLRWQRRQAGLTQAQLARRAKVSQQQIAKLEDPDSNPTLETLEKVAGALGAHLEIALLPNVAATSRGGRAVQPREARGHLRKARRGGTPRGTSVEAPGVTRRRTLARRARR